MRRWLIRLMGLGAIIAGIALAGTVALNSPSKHRPSTFDAAVWKRPVRSCAPSPRGTMTSDLMSKRLRSGMSMRRVRDLLGAPDEVTAGGGWVYFVDWEDTGFLGTCVSLALYVDGGRLAGSEIDRAD